MKRYEEGYAATFGRTIPGLDVEIMNWTLRLAAEQPEQPQGAAAAGRQARHGALEPRGLRPGRSGHEERARSIIAPILSIGSLVPGPAVIAEDETTTIVPKSFAARINPIGAILMEKV